MHRDYKVAMNAPPEVNEVEEGERSTNDSRSAIRYSLRAPVVYSWTDCEGVTHESEGFTRDVSPKGIFIVCADSPPQSTPLTVSIQLPVSGQDCVGEVRIEAVGKVLRLEIQDTTGNGGGFSVKNYRVRYERAD